MANKHATKTDRQRKELEDRVAKWNRYMRERSGLKKRDASIFEIQRRRFLNTKLGRIAPLIGYTFVHD
tara:strand:+ start:237 stop:440 length:204 start_codon:yes stop_codon:yes gene_type:complete